MSLKHFLYDYYDTEKEFHTLVDTTSWKFLIKTIWSRKLHFFVIISLIAAAASSAIALQYMLKIFIDTMVLGGSSAVSKELYHAARTALLCFVAFVLLETAFWRSAGILTAKTIIQINLDIRLVVFDNLTRQSARYFSEHFIGGLGQRAGTLSGQCCAIVNTLIWRIAPPCVDLIGTLVIFTLIDGTMSAVMAFILVCLVSIIIIMGRKGQPLHLAYATQAGRVAGSISDIISNMWSVIVFGSRLTERKRLITELNDEARAHTRSWLHVEGIRIVYDMTIWVVSAAMMSWVLSRWHVGLSTAGDVVLTTTLTFRVLHGARDMMLALADTSQALGQMDEALQVLGKPPGVKDHPRCQEVSPSAGTIEFRQVELTYDSPEGKSPVLGKIDLFIPKGQTVAIVGPSGAGKSTLMALVQRLVDATSGQVLIDGQDVRSVSQESLRRAVSIVPQDITLFHRSIRENILVGNPLADEAALNNALHASNCAHFVYKLPQRLETIVGDRGSRLSNGQRQRVAIARAFIKSSNILILDEATSALDAHSERKILESLEERRSGKTIIAIAHRLSSIMSFDRVIVMQDGMIVEEGAPHDLRVRGGIFQGLYQSQLQGSPV